MRKFLVFPDGTNHELTPLDVEDFRKLGLYAGSLYAAYKRWLAHNDLYELNSYNPDSLAGAVMVLRGGTKDLEFQTTVGGPYQPYTAVGAILAQRNRVGSKCREIADAFLSIWQRQGDRGQ